MHHRLIATCAAVLLSCACLPFVAAAETAPVRLSFASTFPGGMTLIGEAARLLPKRIERA